MTAPKWTKLPITSQYGAKRSYEDHPGMDFASPKGTAIDSPADGIAIVPKPDKMNGNYVVIYHPSGYRTSYSHLESINVKDGQPIKAGDIVGLSGNTGNVRGANGGYHLHFGARDPKGKRIDPNIVLNNPEILGKSQPTAPESAPQMQVAEAPVEQAPTQSTPFDLKAETDAQFASLIANMGKKKSKKTLGLLPGIIGI